MLTEVSMGEHDGSLQISSWAEITAASRMAGGINSKVHDSICRKACLRRSSSAFLSFIAAASGRNMMLVLVCLSCFKIKWIGKMYSGSMISLGKRNFNPSFLSIDLCLFSSSFRTVLSFVLDGFSLKLLDLLLFVLHFVVVV